MNGTVVTNTLNQLKSNNIGGTDITEFALSLFGIDLKGNQTQDKIELYFNNDNPKFTISKSSKTPTSYSEGNTFYQDHAINTPETIKLGGIYARHSHKTYSAKQFVSPLDTTLGAIQSITNNAIMTEQQRYFFKNQASKVDTLYSQALNYVASGKVIQQQYDIFANLINGTKNNDAVNFVKKVYNSIDTFYQQKIPLYLTLPELGTLKRQYLLQECTLEYDPLHPLILSMQATLIEYQSVVITYSTQAITKTIKKENVNTAMTSKTDNTAPPQKLTNNSAIKNTIDLIKKPS